MRVLVLCTFAVVSAFSVKDVSVAATCDVDFSGDKKIDDFSRSYMSEHSENLEYMCKQRALKISESLRNACCENGLINSFSNTLTSVAQTEFKKNVELGFLLASIGSSLSVLNSTGKTIVNSLGSSNVLERNYALIGYGAFLENADAIMTSISKLPERLNCKLPIDNFSEFLSYGKGL